MVRFFFYNKLTNEELIKKISDNFEIYDGFILMEKYDIENNILEISNKTINNNKLLHGKIVNFNMTLNDIIKKINEIKECILKNRTKYTLETIMANTTLCGSYKTYIIY
jgi:hypothetical protein